MRPIGDIARFFVANRHQATLSKASETAAFKMTHGVVRDTARHLGGATMPLSLLARKSQLVAQQLQTTKDTKIFATASQSALANVQSITERLTSSLALTTQFQTTEELSILSRDALGAFDGLVSALNTNIAGKFLFSGSAIDTPPLEQSRNLMNDIKSSIGAATTATDVIAALDTWFHTSGGSFETNAYSGSTTGYVRIALEPEQSITFGLRADDDVIRNTLKFSAMLAIAGDESIPLDVNERRSLIQLSRDGLTATSRELIYERSQIGLAEARISETLERLDTETARIEEFRHSLIGVDQFEAATELEAAQQQLEVFYRVTARRNQTSLADYLR